MGLTAARARDGRLRGPRAFAYALLALLPDVDALGLSFGIPYGSPLGHRGATHSLVAAGVVGLAQMGCDAGTRRLGRRAEERDAAA